MMHFDDERHPMPFSVPDGYFDNLTDRVMKHIIDEDQEQPKKTKGNMKRLFPYAAAASVVAAAIGIGIYLNFSDNQQATQGQTQTVQVAQNDDTQTIDEMADYFMYDDNDLYAYISGE